MFRKYENAKKRMSIDSVSNLSFFCTGKEVLLAKYVNPGVAEARKGTLIHWKSFFFLFLLTGRAGVRSDIQTRLKTNGCVQINGEKNTWGQHKRRLATGLLLNTAKG